MLQRLKEAKLPGAVDIRRDAVQRQQGQDLLDEWVCTSKPAHPSFVLNLETLQSCVSLFNDGIDAELLYAVKCNPHPRVLQALSDAGIRSFDTASLPEIQLVAEVNPESQSYFHHPIKSREAIQCAARDFDVRHFTIDCMAELEKVAGLASQGSTLHVRLAPPSSEGACGFNDKFGVGVAEACTLLETAAGQGFQTGVSFHVGSQCRDPDRFLPALEMVAEVAGRTAVDIGWINCGGGFPVDTSPQQTVPPISAYLKVLSDRLPALCRETGAKLLIEPGRALIAEAMKLIVQVQQRRDQRLYLNDGTYGALSKGCCGCGQQFSVRPIGDFSGAASAFEIFGPTCDVTDKLSDQWLLPDDIGEGDWIEVATMGAYTGALSTGFNGFHVHDLVVQKPSGISS